MSLLYKVRNQRLRNWIILAVALLSAIAIISPEQLGVTLYKLSLVSIAAILGYHLDRALFPYASPGGYLANDWKKKNTRKISTFSGIEYYSGPEHPVAKGYELIFAVVLIRRALIVAAICLGVTMGL
jgi:hypothetical protein